jgi:hypothetical protein
MPGRCCSAGWRCGRCWRRGAATWSKAGRLCASAAAVAVLAVVSTLLQWLPANGAPAVWAGALDATVLLAIAIAVTWPLLGLRPSVLWLAPEAVTVDRPTASDAVPDGGSLPAATASVLPPDAAPDLAADAGRDDVALARLDRAEGESIGARA